MSFKFWACALLRRVVVAFSELSVAGALFAVPASGPIRVEVDWSKPAGQSSFTPGITLIEDSLEFRANDRAAVEKARDLAGHGIGWMNCQLMAWGVGDPWPDPAQPGPTEWTRMDARMQTIATLGARPVITLCEAPWWMKGHLERDGTTRLIPDIRGEWRARKYETAFHDYRGLSYPAGYESPDPYASRILDNQMERWLTLVEAVARRYMVPPYNVRRFQVWNELKGYFDPQANRWAFDDAAGDPSGWNARNGYTFMYNRVYERLKDVARQLNIDAATVAVGGPYPVMVSAGGNVPAGRRSAVTGRWGTIDRRSLEVVTYWLAHKTGAEFITVDGSNGNKTGGEDAEEFARSEKFAAVNRWIRTQPGGETIPIWWAEWYVRLPADGTPANVDAARYENALGAYAAIQQISSSAAVTLLWGGQTETAHPGLWTSTRRPGGGQPRPWYYTYTSLGRHFGAGTKLYAATASSDAIGVLASRECLLLVNKRSDVESVQLPRGEIALDPYAVRFVDPNTGATLTP